MAQREAKSASVNTNCLDHYHGGYNNVIDGVSAVAALDNGPGRSRLDMAVIAHAATADAAHGS